MYVFKQVSEIMCELQIISFFLSIIHFSIDLLFF